MTSEARVETLTVLFTDLVASTALRVRVGEEHADRLRRRHDGLVAGVIGDHHGRLFKHTGDGVMATFEGASDAVAAGVAIQQALAAENRLRADTPLLARIGLSAGDVSAEGDDCFGLPVIEAQRLEAAAGAGQILCSSLVRAVARGRGGHEFCPVGALTLKGLDEPVDAEEVAWEPADTSPTDDVPAVLAGRNVFAFTGRDRERERILEGWDAVAGGATKVVLIAGEPGVGKTRLAGDGGRRGCPVRPRRARRGVGTRRGRGGRLARPGHRRASRRGDGCRRASVLARARPLDLVPGATEMIDTGDAQRRAALCHDAQQLLEAVGDPLVRYDLSAAVMRAAP